jgi:hypothetical protein
MRYRKLDSAGDYTLGGSDAFLIDSPQTVAQAILTRLRLLKGEWFLDLSDGTPYSDEVFGKQNGSSDAAIKQRILATPGVTSLLSYSSSYDGTTRVLTVTATVVTQYGQATIAQVL